MDEAFPDDDVTVEFEGQRQGSFGERVLVSISYPGPKKSIEQIINDGGLQKEDEDVQEVIATAEEIDQHLDAYPEEYYTFTPRSMHRFKVVVIPLLYPGDPNLEGEDLSLNDAVALAEEILERYEGNEGCRTPDFKDFDKADLKEEVSDLWKAGIIQQGGNDEDCITGWGWHTLNYCCDDIWIEIYEDREQPPEEE
jgi:hypothetical protein